MRSTICRIRWSIRSAILERATTRLVYDLVRLPAHQETSPSPQPAVVYTLARETHDSDLLRPAD